MSDSILSEGQFHSIIYKLYQSSELMNVRKILLYEKARPPFLTAEE
jgi:hypothetical protein